MSLEQLFTWPVIFFGLFIYFVTLTLRRLVRAKWPTIETNNYWRGVVLPVLPAAVGVGMVFALTTHMVVHYPLPEIAVKTGWAKIMFGATTGFLSGSVYQIFKSLVKKTFGVELKSDFPPAGGSVEVKVTVPPTADPPKIDGGSPEEPPTEPKLP